MLRYRLVPKRVPAMWRRRAATSMRAELPSGNAHYACSSSDLPQNALQGVVGTDAAPVGAWKIVVSKSLVDAVFYLFRRSRQLMKKSCWFACIEAL
jgi:hypothetical protein